MSIVYPLTMPTTGGIRKLTLGMKNANYRQRSPFSYKSFVQDFGGDHWVAQVELSKMTKTDADQWIAFLNSLRGTVGSFYLSDPLRLTPKGVATGTPLINGAGQSGRSLITDGWTNSTTGILKAGDYINISSHYYMITKDVNSNGSGQATVDIMPSLREVYPDNTAIVVSNCKGVFALSSSDTQLHSVDFEKFHSIEFTCEEVI